MSSKPSRPRFGGICARRRALAPLALCLLLGLGVADEATAQTDVRVATWNVQTIGAPGTPQYNALLAVLQRIGADVVAINEVGTVSDIDNLYSLALDAGFADAVVPTTTPFGTMRNAFLTRSFPILNQTFFTSASLSGDPNANDLTRYVVGITVAVPGGAKNLTLLVEHWKSGTGNANEFRRSIESYRIAQALAGRDTSNEAYMVMGDVNEELGTHRFPATFVTAPTGLSSAFRIGADIQSEMAGPGLPNDVFGLLQGAPALTPLDAMQVDGSYTTRPSSGRRLDYIFVSPALQASPPLSEVYDSQDEGLPGGIPKVGVPLGPTASLDAADHLLVFTEITVPPAFTVNMPPTVTDDVAQTVVGLPVAIAVLANDTDPNGDALTVASLTQPTSGQAVLNADQTITYTPFAGFFGLDAFSYVATDGQVSSSIATVTVTVNPSGTPAQITSTPPATASVGALYSYTVNATGDPPPTLTATGSGGAALPGWLAFDPQTGVLAGTPAATDAGPHALEIHAANGLAPNALQSFSVTVSVPPTTYALATYTFGVTGAETTAPASSAAGLAAGGFSSADGAYKFYTGAVGSPDKALGDNGWTGANHFEAPLAPDAGFALTLSEVVFEDQGSSTGPQTYTVEIVDRGTVIAVASGSGATHGRFTGITVPITGAAAGPFEGPVALRISAVGALSSRGTWRIDNVVISGAVTPISGNQPPAATADSLATAEDTLAVLDVLANDTDPDGDPLTVAGITQGALGTVSQNPDGTLSYDPNPNANGTDSFTYTVSDGNGGSAVGPVLVTIAPVNDAPVAAPDAAATTEGVAVLVYPLANDTDVDGDALTISGFGPAVHGAVVAAGAGALSYAPVAGFFGTDSFTYTAQDPSGATAKALVTVTVAHVNAPPVALADAATTPEDQPVTVDVLANDSDADGDALTVASFTQPVHGAVASAGGGLLTYAPFANWNGTDTFTYTASDGQGGTAQATVTVTVMPVNDPPVAVGDQASTNQGQAVVIAVTANDTDADGDALGIASFTQPPNGAVAQAGTSLTYAPFAGFFGTDTFTYIVSDGQGGTAQATVTVTVIHVNAPPVALADAATTPEDQPVTVDVLANDSDADGDALTVASFTQPVHGAVASAGGGLLTYAPFANWNGTDTFTYTASDGQGGTAQATVTVTVTPVNDPPVAATEGYDMLAGSVLTVAAPGVLSNDTDPDGDALAATVVTDPVHGTLALHPDGSFQYTPAAGFQGQDTFTYAASDKAGASSSAIVTIVVAPAGDTIAAILATYNVAKRKLSIDATSSAQPLAVLKATFTVGGKTRYRTLKWKAKKGFYRVRAYRIPRPDGDQVVIVSDQGGQRTVPLVIQ